MIERRLDDHTAVCGQIEPHEIAGLADAGVTLLVNNRPDGEAPNQPPAAEIEAAARAAGIAYRFVPVRYGIGPAEIAGMRDAIQATGSGKLLAFCRSGTRSALTWGLAKRAEGVSADEIVGLLSEAGFDPGPIAHLI
ncbi:TIGR01244 family sulfur transferase [Sphingomonas sp.]|uniref:TIGR01244 family sulfur transferase n=1 Tax=Sphingomonas sp. TaxID=28214 RepID=UPI0025EC7653|nr:TIGR01244 family sulfur transferase [Sphingomonas sp.]MBV9528268.1 TIGR01244 family phosphatase [Sphingomonas sp.]